MKIHHKWGYRYQCTNSLSKSAMKTSYAVTITEFFASNEGANEFRESIQKHMPAGINTTVIRVTRDDLKEVLVETLENWWIDHKSQLKEIPSTSNSGLLDYLIYFLATTFMEENIAEVPIPDLIETIIKGIPKYGNYSMSDCLEGLINIYGVSLSDIITDLNECFLK